MSATDRVTELAARDESSRLEFRLSRSKPENVARVISGFANSAGGTILIGVDGRDKNLAGVDVEEAMRTIASALSLLQPEPEVRMESVQLDSKNFLLVDVPPSSRVIYSPTGPYVRAGREERPATPEEVWDRLPAVRDAANDQTDIRQLVRVVSHQTAMIEAQGVELAALRAKGHWKNQLMWVTVGAVLGAILGGIVTVFLG